MSTKSLGISVDETQRLEEPIKYIKRQMVSAPLALRSTKYGTLYMMRDTIRTFCYTLIYPKWTYGVLLWGSAYRTDLNQLKYYKRM